MRRAARAATEAVRATAQTTVVAVVAAVMPVWLRRLVRHEFVLWACLLRWIARRGPHGVRDGGTAVAYASGQAAIMYGFLFASVVETIVLALIVPWPLVHLIVLAIDLWGVFFVLALHASCVVRPHVVEADGSLRLRYGALVDIRIPESSIATVRRERRYPDGHLFAVGDDETGDVIVAGETSIAVELVEPVTVVRPLGRKATVRTLRFYAEDPRAAMAAIAAASATEPEAGRTSRASSS